MWGFPYREKPRLLHVFIGVGVSAFSLALLWLNFPNLLSNLITQVLLAGHISVEKSLNSEAPLLVVKLLDGSKLDLTLTWQRSGLASITIFGLLFLSLMFPLKGSIWRKTAWLELGFIIGLTWSFIRLSIAVLVAYHFGASAFTVTEFLTGPFTDFFWVVSVWSLGLSALISTKDKKEELK
jgi:hypothetical protein